MNTYLAFDWGQLRVGVASGNDLTQTAQSVTTLTEKGEERFVRIAKLIKEWRPAALVVGVPYHPDGAPHKNTQHAKRFCAELRTLSGLVVHEVDERYSTTQAKQEMASLGGKSVKQNAKSEGKLDSLSAVIILEQFLRTI